MLRAHALRAGADAVLNAAMLGDGWEEALSHLSAAAEARGVALIRNRNKRLAAALANRNIAEPIADYLAGKAPPNSRQIRVDHTRRPGFRLDFDDYTPEQLSRDPFYQDFLRPIGAFWHANAQLEYEPGDELAISFKRDLDRGSYSRADTELLNLILPDLQVAMRVAQAVLGARSDGMARALHRRGDPVLELDRFGYVLRTHGFQDMEGGPLRVRRRRLVCRSRAAQLKLDHAITTATVLGRAASLVLGSEQPPCHMDVLPVNGAGRDVFRAAAAVIVLTYPSRPSRPSQLAEDVQAAFALTHREFQIATELLKGRSVSEMAGILGVEGETVRFHLKGLFRKTSTGRQGELIALLARLSS